MEGSQIVPSLELRSAYEAALGACLAVEHDAPGLVRLRGATTLDFLHRMSTNDMTGLAPGGMRGTVLTTAIGRTVDVVQVLRRPGDILLLTAPGKAANVREWLSRYIFFNDDVQTEIVSDPFSFFGVYGPTSAAAVEELGASLPAGPGSFSEVGDGLLWTTAQPLQGFQLLASGELASRARALWGRYFLGPSAVQAYEAIRVERGYPAVGREIDGDAIPLEVGLWELVSFRKGCYIGQEVIARMESRSRVARRLVGLRLDVLEESPQEVLLDRQPIGRLTSVALSPRFGPIGLALVRASAVEGGHGEFVLSPAGSAAGLQTLPFDDATA